MFIRRKGFCLIKTIIGTFIICTITLMIYTWITDPQQSQTNQLLPVGSFRNRYAKFFTNKNDEKQPQQKQQQQQQQQQQNNENQIKSNDINSIVVVNDNDVHKKIMKIDWHDHFSITKQLLQEGLGEKGKPAHMNDGDKLKERELYNQNGFNAYLSDHISVNRSVPDIRNPGCQTKMYLNKLPKVSVIIPVFNEHWSTLLRSCYSILNRSPPELLEEIILVDDHSTKDFLGEKLDKFVKKYLPKVKIIHLPERSGLIRARLAGARQAKAEVLIFLDSHVEANYNWLPPLLEPIAINPKACTCPFIDVIDHDTFEYRAQDEGARGAFDWQFYYKRLPLLPEDLVDRTKPFKSPIMAGGLFAIRADFFWELGGYDEGLDIWGGEQYELSFKIWMCGGEMLDTPCSRVGHIYRGSVAVPFKNPRKGDYLHVNYKRVAEVWMDEYKNYLYERNPDRYESIDPGDLTKQKEIRKRLKCKSFKWFMKNVAFDLPKKYPPVEPLDYAHGTIRSELYPYLCLDSLNHGVQQEPGLFQCATNHVRPHLNQNWALTWHKDIRLKGRTECLDVSKSTQNAPVILYECHGQQGNQLWFYEIKNKWLMHGKNMRCLEANGAKKIVYVNDCDASNKNMRWIFGYANETALKYYYNDDNNNNGRDL